MKTKLTYKIINYLGDYGTANFWSNITPGEIQKDLRFINEQGFNSILLMIPYCAFKPSLDSFESKYTDTLNFIMSEAKQLDMHVIFRIGYLWESNFEQDRTLERYIDMYSKNKINQKSKYEDDFVEFVRYYYDHYDFLHMMISWEDFFWPINFHNLTGNNDNQENERETIRFLEYLLGRVGEREKLFVEQRTNGDFNKITYNPSISYAYYNTYNIQSWDDDYIDRNFGRGILLSGSLLIEKQFVEWFSRMKKELELGSDNKLIIDQFNIIDNTFSDDDDQQEFNVTKQKLLCTESKLEEVLDFLAPIIKHNIYGIGFWSLWTTYAGHVYNGTFKFGFEGWETNGQLTQGGLTLNQRNTISTNLGYIRLDSTKRWNLLIKYSALKSSKVMIKFNNTCEILDFEMGEQKVKIVKFNYIKDRNFFMECISESITIHRIDCFNIRHKSFLFDENRCQVCDLPSMKILLS